MVIYGRARVVPIAMPSWSNLNRKTQVLGRNQMVKENCCSIIMEIFISVQLLGCAHGNISQVQLFKVKLIKYFLKMQFLGCTSYILSAQELHVATILNSPDLQLFHRGRKFNWTQLCVLLPQLRRVEIPVICLAQFCWVGLETQTINKSNIYVNSGLNKVKLVSFFAGLIRAFTMS